MRKLKKAACLLTTAALVMSLVGCGSGDSGSGSSSSSSSSSNESDSSSAELGESVSYTGDPAFAKFDEPVDVHIGMWSYAADDSLPEGDSVDNNQYTRYLKENYNINVIVDWTAEVGSNYREKVSLAIASDTLPDAVVANDMTYIKKAYDADLLYDMTNIWEKYASKQVKGIIESGSGRAMNSVTFDGRIYGLPGAGLRGDSINTLIVRQDWLDKYGLDAPKTLDDIEHIARVFKEEKPAGDATIPILGPGKGGALYTSFLGTTNWYFAFTPIFNACDAYPGYWIDNGDGTATYGSISENMKVALQRLNSWYEEGLIDPELGTRDNSYDPLNSGQVGMTFGCWSMMGYSSYQSMVDDPEADWQCYPIYDDNGKWNSSGADPFASAIIVNKNVSEDVAHALMIMYNACCRDEQYFDVSVNFDWYPLRLVISAYDEVEYEYQELYKVLNGETTAEDYSDPNLIYKLMYADAQKIRDVIVDYEPGTEIERKNISMDNLGDFMRYYSCLISARPVGKYTVDKEVESVTYVLTDTMEQRWSNLKTMEDEVMLKIILGQESIDAFDQFVADWKAQGGDMITEEVEALIE